MPVANTLQLSLGPSVDSYCADSTNDDGVGSTIPTPILKLVQSEGSKSSSRRSKSRDKKPKKKPSKSPLSHTTRAVSSDEERQISEWKAALRDADNRVDKEHRRAEEALFRAGVAERREQELLAKVEALEAKNLKLETDLVAVEEASRGFQVSLEVSERELRFVQRDLELMKREFDDLDHSRRRTEEESRKYKDGLRDLGERIRERDLEMQGTVKKALVVGETQGYDVGYEDGYAQGKQDGKQAGIKTGRKQGLLEGKEAGRIEERRIAMGAINQLLAGETRDSADRIRRWAKSVYNPLDSHEKVLS